MLKNFEPKVKNLLNKKNQLISTVSTEIKLQILEAAESGNVEILKQKIECTYLGGDY